MARDLFEFVPSHFEVVEHRPNGEHGSGGHQYIADKEEIPAVAVFQADKQHDDGGHLGGGFEFADAGDGDAAAFAHLCHPFAQGGDGDFAADDDHGEHRMGCG